MYVNNKSFQNLLCQQKSISLSSLSWSQREVFCACDPAAAAAAAAEVSHADRLKHLQQSSLYI
jgi:hypothetical protein